MDKKTIIKFNILAILCIVIFCIALTPVSLQNDTFYTIKIGEHILQNGMTHIDSFTWHEGIPYTYPHWAYDVLIYLIFSLGGYLGIYISTAVLACVLGLLIYFTNSKITKNNLTSFILTIGSMYLLKDYIAARAQLVTFILFTLTLLFIELFLSTKKKRYAIYLIIISFIIANLHVAVWPFFFVLFLPYIAEYLICTVVDLDIVGRISLFLLKFKKDENLEQKIEELKTKNLKIEEKRKALKENPYRIKTERNTATKWLIVIIVICLIIGAVAAFGDNPYTHLYKLTKGNSTQNINEHLPAVLINEKEFLAIILMFLGILIFTDIKIKLRDLFMIGGLLLLAFISKRQISMFVIIGSTILNKLICAFFDKYDKDGCNKYTKYVVTWLGHTMAIVIILFMSIVFIRPKLNDKFVDLNAYPVEATKFIKENLDVDNIKLYNEYNYGSYLLLNDIKVFIDSRCDLYTKEFNGEKDIFSDFINISNINTDYETMFEKYDFTHLMMYKNAKLNLFIKRDENYNKIYEDGSFIIYERK